MTWRGAGKRSCAAIAAALVLILSACDGDSSHDSTSEPQTEPPAETPGSAVRVPAPPMSCTDTEILPTDDVHGEATGATLWALPMSPLPFDAGPQVKIVWRMTGSGPPQFTVTKPGGGKDPNALEWGPEEHASSSWHRPGDEWGTGFRFTGPGCWHITVRRADGVGTLAVRVVDRA